MKIEAGAFSGNSTEIGIAKGKTYSEIINKMVFEQHPILSEQQLIKNLVLKFKFTVKQIAPDIFNEIEGITLGSYLPHDTVWAYNLFSEIYRINPGCTIFGISSEKNTLIGKTNDGDEKGLDWFYCIEKTVKKGKHAHLSVVWQGTVWSIGGINDAGVTMVGSSAHNDNFNIEGFPTNMIIRLILEDAGSLDEAIEMVRNISTTGSPANYILGDQDNGLAVIEKSPETTKLISKRKGMFYRTNRFLHPELLLSWKDIKDKPELIRRIDNCCRRESYLNICLDNTMSETDFRQILRDPNPVGAIFQAGQENFYTAIGLVINVKEKKISVSISGGEFSEFFLDNP